MKIQTKISSLIFILILVTGIVIITSSYIVYKQKLYKITDEIKGMNWCLLVDAEEALVNRLVQLMIFFFVVLLCVSGILAFFIAKNITRPILKMTAQLKNAQDKLLCYQDKLEKLVKERTAALNQANEQLQDKIIEKEKTEQALKESKKRLKESQKIACLGQWELDLVTNTLHWSDEIYRIFDIDPNNFGETYETFLALIHPDDREMVNQAYINSLKNKKSYNIVHRLLLKNGTIKFVNEICRTEYDEAGNPLCSIGTVQDITKHKQIKESLRRFRAALDNSADAFFIIDRQAMKFIDMNKMACDSVGYSSEELLSMGPQDIKPHFTKTQLAAKFDEIIHSQCQGTIETTHQRKDGTEFPVEVLLQSLKFDEGYLLVASVRDITERKRHEKALQQAKEKADSASRAKSEFIANMSHEIRTPMNAVIGFSDILASKITDKQQKSYLNSIQTAGKSLLTLINDILDLSKIEAGRLDIQYEPVNPQVIFTELQQIFSLKIAEKNLQLIMEIDESLPPALFLDETRLRQVLLNLIGNAVKFTDTGYIKLCANKIYTEDDHSKVDLILAVEDSGIGIPANQQTLIFESFRQQDGQSAHQYGGTGLGLAITKRLVEMMNGQISVESQPGKGSRFEIVLHEVNVVVTLPPIRPDNTFGSNNIIFEKARVLVVDDIEYNRSLIEEYLSQVNLEIISAENGQKALLFVEEYRPALILMDIRMPEMNGYEACKHLKNNPNTADIPIIALTASVALNEKASIKAHGFDGFLAKPVNISELLRELSHYLKYSTLPYLKIKPEIDTMNNLTPSEKAKVLEWLEKTILQKWKKLEGILDMDEIKAFANSIKNLGEEYHISGLIRYGKNLSELTQEFSIVEIEETLAQFPKLINSLKNN